MFQHIQSQGDGGLYNGGSRGREPVSRVAAGERESVAWLVHVAEGRESVTWLVHVAEGRESVAWVAAFRGKESSAASTV